MREVNSKGAPFLGVVTSRDEDLLPVFSMRGRPRRRPPLLRVCSAFGGCTLANWTTHAHLVGTDHGARFSLCGTHRAELREQLADDGAPHVGQAEVTSLVAVGQAGVVQAKAMQDRGLQVIHFDCILDDF